MGDDVGEGRFMVMVSRGDACGLRGGGKEGAVAGDDGGCMWGMHQER